MANVRIENFSVPHVRLTSSGCDYPNTPYVVTEYHENDRELNSDPYIQVRIGTVNNSAPKSFPQAYSNTNEFPVDFFGVSFVMDQHDVNYQPVTGEPPRNIQLNGEQNTNIYPKGQGGMYIPFRPVCLFVDNGNKFFVFPYSPPSSAYYFEYLDGDLPPGTNKSDWTGLLPITKMGFNQVIACIEPVAPTTFTNTYPDLYFAKFVLRREAN